METIWPRCEGITRVATYNDHEDGPVAAYLESHARPERAGGGPARPWRDAVGSSMRPTTAPLTLDIAGNPRWTGSVVSERSGRFDRIYLRGTRGRPAPKVRASGLFGRRPANRFGIVPSDHYGVFVDLEF